MNSAYTNGPIIVSATFTGEQQTINNSKLVAFEGSS